MSHSHRLLSKNNLFHRLAWEDIDPAYLRVIVSLAKEEDAAGLGLLHRSNHPIDITTQALNIQGQGRAVLVARQAMILCGLGLIPFFIEAYDTLIRFIPRVQDKDSLLPGQIIGALEGPIVALLMAERPILNALQHLSGISTYTQTFIQVLGDSATRILDTRKTHPTWRALEKYAVACGGGYNHRLGLFDRILIKDNHLTALGATAGDRLRSAVIHARKAFPAAPLEVEVDCLDQILPVLDAKPDMILLDNFSQKAIREAVQSINHRALTAASGGINLNNLAAFAGIGLDFISIGALTHQSTWVDIGLDWLDTF